jgi:hypothetical protein
VIRLDRAPATRTLAGCLAVLLGLITWPDHAAAQQRALNEEELVDFGYATWFGTGIYTVADREVIVLRIPFEWTMREPLQVENKWGWKWLMPLTVGFHRFDFDLSQLTGFDLADYDTTAQSASFVPGVELQLPVSEVWRLEPFAQAGLGQDLSGTELVYIYGFGIKSYYDLSHGEVDYLIANRLLYGGQTFRDSRDTTGFASFETALELRLPGTVDIGRFKIDSSVFGVVSWFGNRVEFLAPRGEEQVSRVVELGFSLGINEGFSLWNFDIPRVGMSFMRGENDFRAIRFNAGFSF